MLIETNITYIPTNNGMTYLMCIKDVFSKEWYGYNYNTSCIGMDAVNAVDDAIIRRFNGKVIDNITLRTDNCPSIFPGSSMSILKQ
jgi:putative transposase